MITEDGHCYVFGGVGQQLFCRTALKCKDWLCLFKCSAFSGELASCCSLRQLPYYRCCFYFCSYGNCFKRNVPSISPMSAQRMHHLIGLPSPACCSSSAWGEGERGGAKLLLKVPTGATASHSPELASSTGREPGAILPLKPYATNQWTLLPHLAIQTNSGRPQVVGKETQYIWRGLATWSTNKLLNSMKQSIFIIYKWMGEKKNTYLVWCEVPPLPVR